MSTRGPRTKSHADGAVPWRRPGPGHGPVLDAILTVLADGRPRSSHELLADVIARGELSRNLQLGAVDDALRGYLERKAQSGRRAAIVRDPDRRYRLNHPRDLWPEPSRPLTFPAPTHATLVALETARAASLGTDPAAFERAVCEFFATLGFIATHVGGNAAPDGYIDAPLGPLGYRVVLECKTGRFRGAVSVPNVSEPARYRDTYGAQACALVGPAFQSEAVLSSELHIHGVSAWTVDDLATLAHAALDPHAMRPLFDSGFAEDALDDVLWERSHGVGKRVAVIAEMLQHVAAREQRIVKKPSDAPRLTIEAAALCINEALADSGSDARCVRDDVEAAFTWMTHPLVRSAVWDDASRTAIVVVACAESSESEVSHAAR